MPGEATTYRPTAVLIRGNPNVGKGGPYARFYRQLNEELAMQGFDVTEDAGEARTLPKPADLWLGFSRGAGRLQYAPEGVRTLPVGSKVEGAINHPDDDVHTPWHLVGRSPPAAHAKIPPGLREKLREIAMLIAQERQNKLAVDPRDLILVTGHSDAGKSYTAGELGKRLGLPVVSIDDHPDNSQLFKNDPDNLHLVRGSQERLHFFKERQRIAREILGSLQSPSIVEGSQLAQLSSKELQQYPNRVLVKTPLTKLLEQRIARVRAKALAKGKPWDDEIEQKRFNAGREIYDGYRSTMSRAARVPGTVIMHNHKQTVDEIMSQLGIKQAASPLVAAGLCVLAADTGRVLMLQRAFDDADPASGKWEFPGGHIEDYETPLQAAKREWSEEIGSRVPKSLVVAESWRSGVYVGYVGVVPSEKDVKINKPAGRRYLNPDDPDGDNIETAAWWVVKDLKNNKTIRAELQAAISDVTWTIRLALMKSRRGELVKTAQISKIASIESGLRQRLIKKALRQLTSKEAGIADAASNLWTDIRNSPRMHQLGLSGDALKHIGMGAAAGAGTGLLTEAVGGGDDKHYLRSALLGSLIGGGGGLAHDKMKNKAPGVATPVASNNSTSDRNFGALSAGLVTAGGGIAGATHGSQVGSERAYDAAKQKLLHRANDPKNVLSTFSEIRKRPRLKAYLERASNVGRVRGGIVGGGLGTVAGGLLGLLTHHLYNGQSNKTSSISPETLDTLKRVGIGALGGAGAGLATEAVTGGDDKHYLRSALLGSLIGGGGGLAYDKFGPPAKKAVTTAVAGKEPQSSGLLTTAAGVSGLAGAAAGANAGGLLGGSRAADKALQRLQGHASGMAPRISNANHRNNVADALATKSFDKLEKFKNVPKGQILYGADLVELQQRQRDFTNAAVDARQKSNVVHRLRNVRNKIRSSNPHANVHTRNYINKSIRAGGLRGAGAGGIAGGIMGLLLPYLVNAAMGSKTSAISPELANTLGRVGIGALGGAGAGLAAEAAYGDEDKNYMRSALIGSLVGGGGGLAYDKFGKPVQKMVSKAIGRDKPVSLTSTGMSGAIGAAGGVIGGGGRRGAIAGGIAGLLVPHLYKAITGKTAALSDKQAGIGSMAGSAVKKLSPILGDLIKKARRLSSSQNGRQALAGGTMLGAGAILSNDPDSALQTAASAASGIGGAALLGNAGGKHFGGRAASRLQQLANYIYKKGKSTGTIGGAVAGGAYVAAPAVSSYMNGDKTASIDSIVESLKSSLTDPNYRPLVTGGIGALTGGAASLAGEAASRKQNKDYLTAGLTGAIAGAGIGGGYGYLTRNGMTGLAPSATKDSTELALLADKAKGDPELLAAIKAKSDQRPSTILNGIRTLHNEQQEILPLADEAMAGAAGYYGANKLLNGHLNRLGQKMDGPLMDLNRARQSGVVIPDFEKKLEGHLDRISKHGPDLTATPGQRSATVLRHRPEQWRRTAMDSTAPKLDRASAAGKYLKHAVARGAVQPHTRRPVVGGIGGLLAALILPRLIPSGTTNE